jgi:hypothetical protein
MSQATLVIRNHFFCGLAILSMGIVACNRAVQDTQETASETYISVPGAVPFDIQPLPRKAGSEWLATYQSHGKTARFRIEFRDAHNLDDKDSLDFDAKSGKGSFVAEPGSDCSALLSDLKVALEAKSLPAKVHRVNTLPFTFVSFGRNQSQAPDGGFFADPPGNWMPIKISIGHGDQEGQVFVNVNPVLRKGQFSVKDPEYGDIVLKQLASVL